jgi:hypothetical protein
MLLYSDGEAFKCDYFSFAFRFLFTTGDSTVVKLALVSICCGAVVAFTAFALVCKYSRF